MSGTVDSHVHLWDLRHTPQPWMTQEHAAIARPFGPGDLKPLMDQEGIDAAVVVQGACLDSDTDYLFAEADRHDWIAAVTAWLCLDQPGRARERLDELATRPKFRAVRHLVHNEPDAHWLTRGDVTESLGLLEARDVILEVPVVFPRHFDDVAAVARRFPALRIVIDHLGKPPIGTSALPRWEALLRDVARHPNVMAKISGLNTTVAHADWSAADWTRPVEVALESFGPDRLMCGSDWPVALLNGDYARVWDATRKVVQVVAPGCAGALFGSNARRIYQLDVPLRRGMAERSDAAESRPGSSAAAKIG
ncbi:MAG: amidohydrolase family protein [Streptosporangiaceae bacterium]